jgi:hypothetical protein
VVQQTERPVLAAVARAAAELTGASGAAVVAPRGEEIVVLAVAGPHPERVVGERLKPGDDTLSFVLGAGQGLSLARADGAGSSCASMCVPCSGPEGVLGAVELRGAAGAGQFSVEAVRAAALLAEVATAALGAGAEAHAPTPSELSAELVELAASDGARYAAVALAIEALLAGG